MKTLSGTIISTKMARTMVVETVRRTPHPLYKKIVTKRKKYKVDSGDFTVSQGDMIKIAETKPISKDKHFRIIEVLKAKKE